MKKMILITTIILFLLLGFFYVKGEYQSNGDDLILWGYSKSDNDLVLKMSSVSSISTITRYYIIYEDNAIYIELYEAKCFLFWDGSDLTNKLVINDYDEEDVFIKSSSGGLKAILNAEIKESIPVLDF